MFLKPPFFHDPPFLFLVLVFFSLRTHRHTPIIASVGYGNFYDACSVPSSYLRAFSATFSVLTGPLPSILLSFRPVPTLRRGGVQPLLSLYLAAGGCTVHCAVPPSCDLVTDRVITGRRAGGRGGGCRAVPRWSVQKLHNTSQPVR